VVKIKELIKSIKGAHKYATKEGIKAAKKLHTTSEMQYYRGSIEAYEYVFKEINRIYGIKIRKA
jgi:hypothetical protein